MKYLILTFILLSLNHSYSQEGLPFSPNKQIYLKGNSALIGNNIVSTDAVEPFNDSKGFNDVLKLKYIDVDGDPSTFSSSQANLTIAHEASTIKYAALYWSAVYKYDKGVRRELGQKIVYRGNNKRSKDIHSILFKTPQGNYHTIKGVTIFDSFSGELFDKNKPYVCYADVTSYLQNSKSLDGTYTVANMKATEGFISGGASGGWLLYIVYETKTAKPKYFTTYNGFIQINKKPVDIVFKDFKTNESGDIKTSLSFGVLEGDQKIKTDNCSILDTKNESYIPLSNKFRPVNNFFNSTITINDELYKDRTPNSLNTLGFDLLKIGIPNTDNAILSNNVSELTIRFKTKADRFYLFFVAFETEISPIYLEGKNNVDSILVLENSEENEEDIPKEEVKEIVSEEQKNAVDKITKLKSVAIPSVPKGYYLVTNVFSVKGNATKWMQYLKEKGHQPNSYINPKNGWNYIYLKNDEDPNSIYLKQKELSKLSYFKDIWILKINF